MPADCSGKLAASPLHAGGRRFESCTAHSEPRSHADSAWLRGSAVPGVPEVHPWCLPRCHLNISPSTATAMSGAAIQARTLVSYLRIEERELEAGGPN